VGMECDCKDFKIGMPQIISAQVMVSPTIHSWGTKYTGKVFKFCPWCAKPLAEVKDKSSSDLIGKELSEVLDASERIKR